MWRRNEGRSETDTLQNRFTSYVATAVRRRRRDYILKLSERQMAEAGLNYEMEDTAYNQDAQMFSELPLMLQLESDALLYALKGLTERERHIFLAHVLDEKDFEVLAAEYGMQYKGITTAYYRIIKKIRLKMKEVKP